MSKNNAPRPHGPRGMGGGMTVEKPKNFKKSLGRLAKYCKRYMWFIITALIFAAAGSVLTLIGPSKLQELTDIITKALPIFDADTGIWSNLGMSVEMQSVASIGIFLIILYVLGALFNYIEGFIMATITQRMSKRMRRDITSKINRLPLKYMDSTPYGDVLSRVTNDVDTIGQTLNNSITTLVSAVALLVGCIIMMFVTNWILALTAIAASLLGFVLVMIIMRFSQKHFVAQQNELGNINGHIEEVYSGHDIVNVYNGKRETREEFDRINQKLYTSAWKSQFL